MNDDLEDRLRRTYRAVGDNTFIDAEAAHEARPGTGHRAPSSRWAAPALVASIVLLVAGGLAVINGIRTDAPADTSRTHVLPTWLPNPYAPPTESPGGRPPLVSIESSADTDVLAYASDVLSMTIRVDRVAVEPLAGSPIDVRAGSVATADGGDEDGRLRWTALDGVVVTIEWEGPVFGGVDSIATVMDGLIVVDDETWKTAIEFGGFTPDREMLRRSVGSMEGFVVGDLQSGMSHALGSGYTMSGFVPSPCATFDSYDGEVAVVSRFPRGTARVTWSDGEAASTELQPFVPGSVFGVGVVERAPSEESERPDIVCEEAS